MPPKPNRDTLHPRVFRGDNVELDPQTMKPLAVSHTPAAADSELQWQRYHLSYCDKYETLRGIYPNDRRLTGEPCSCGLEDTLAARDRRLELEARIDEAQKIYTNYISSGTLVGKAVLKRIRRYKAALGSTDKREQAK